jgi:hypothetical protein
MPQIYAYEVQLVIIDKKTQAKTLITRIEHGYGVTDALMMAFVNNMSEHPEYANPERYEVKNQHIGPPADLVNVYGRADLDKAIDEVLTRIQEAKSK